MIAYIILLIFILLVISKEQRGKEIISWILLYCMIAPCIQIGNRKIDSTYVFFLFLICYFVIKQKGKLKIYNNIITYAYAMIICSITYFVGWITHGLRQSSEFVVAVLGLAKNVIALYIFFDVTEVESDRELDLCVGKGLEKTLYLNFISIFLQWLIPQKMYNICNELYYSASSIGYTNYELIGQWGSGFYKGHYYRYFGLFETPMTLSCFVIIIISFFVIQATAKRCYFKYPKLILIISLIMGVLAQCKVFFLMLPILLCLYVVYNINKLDSKKIFIYLVIGVASVFVIVFLNELASISAFHYLKYLTDPLESFNTRFGQDGYIKETMEIAINNIFTGVGPVSIQGEPLADSSYVVLLHNGGIFALLAVLFYFITLWKKNRKQEQPYLNIFIIVILVLGASRTIMITGAILWILIFYQEYCYRNHSAKKFERDGDS